MNEDRRTPGQRQPVVSDDIPGVDAGLEPAVGDATQQAAESGAVHTGRRTHLLREILSWSATFLVPLALVLTLTSTVFCISTVNQRSMLPTLVEGELVYCSRDPFASAPPARGDIVLFYADNRSRGTLLWEFGMRLTDMADNLRGKDFKRNLRYVKRVVGLPGETVDLRDGLVYIDGEMLAEPYAGQPTEARGMSLPLTVPDGQYFLMGDNRSESKDSRDFGCIGMEALEGRVRFRLLPLSRAGAVQ